MLLNVLQFMADLQHPPCEGIDVFDKVFAGGNFPFISFSLPTGESVEKTLLVFVISPGT